MKQNFLSKMLPMMAAAVLLATSCSKDGDNDSDLVNTPDNNSPAQEQVVDNQVKMIPFTITVNKNSLSKASLSSEETLTQIFETDDKLQIKNGGSTLVTLDLTDGEGATSATFSAEIAEGTLESGTKYDVVLTNAAHNNTGAELSPSDIKVATSLTEAFQKYGYLTSTLKYGSETSIQLTQNTVFLRIKPFNGKTTATINGTEYTVNADGAIYLAVKSGTEIESDLFDGKTKTVTNENGKVVKNIDRSDVLLGKFSVALGEQVHFSKGNLQATTSDNGETWTWHFAPTQYAIIGEAAANTSINGNGTVSENGTVDLFGWVGASSTWTGAAQYGISNSTSTNNADGYGKESNEDLKSDWGNLIKEGSPWRALKITEWQYLLGGVDGITPRDKATDLRQWGNVNGFYGLIILPDGCTCSFSDDWSTLEAAGAVFLPAAGYRSGTEAFKEGVSGGYWSSSANGENNAWYLFFADDGVFPNGGVFPDGDSERFYGQSVRLVRSL